MDSSSPQHNTEFIPNSISDQLELNSNNLQRIFESETQSKESQNEQINKLRVLTRQATQIDITLLQQCIKWKICAVIRDNLKEVTTEVQFALLDLLEVISKRGAESAEKDNQNIFYTSIYDTKLENKIKKCLAIKEQNANEGLNGLPFEGITVQLMRIFFYVMKYKSINEKLHGVCSNIISQNSAALVEQLKQFTIIRTDAQNTVDNSSLKISRLIENVLQTFQAFAFPMESYNFGYPEFITVHDAISQYIHLNCPEELHCSQCLSIPINSTVLQLQKVMFQILSRQSFFNDVKEYLECHHRILDHITPMIANQLKSATTTMKYDQLSNIQYIIDFLCIFLDNLQYQQSQSSLMELLPLFISISQQHFNESQDQELNIKMMDFKVKILLCIHLILWNENLSFQEEIVSKFKYFSILTNSIGIAGGSNEHSDLITRLVLQRINSIFKQFHGKALHEKPQCSDSLRITLLEQIEEEGSIDEIEAHSFNITPIKDNNRRTLLDIYRRSLVELDIQYYFINHYKYRIKRNR